MLEEGYNDELSEKEVVKSFFVYIFLPPIRGTRNYAFCKKNVEYYFIIHTSFSKREMNYLENYQYIR